MMKTILISQYSLPYQKIGSWTTMYNQYLTGDHLIDYIICPEVKEKVDKVIYYNYPIKDSALNRILIKLGIINKWHLVIKSLKKILSDHPKENFVIQIIDNYGLQVAVNDFITNNSFQNRLYTQFFYHGFLPYKNESFYSKINELVLLTTKSYIAHLQVLNEMSCKVSILPNGIDTARFTPTSDELRIKIRLSMGLSNEKVFIWCSQDRPKKGLHIVLEAWNRIYSRDKNIHLLVIGTYNQQFIDGVTFLGRLSNFELVEYYQMSDVYLFPTLCQEGFGLSLIEAMHCGCYCVASNLGGVSEVLSEGKYGELIDYPHLVESWITAIEKVIEIQPKVQISSELYSADQWRILMNRIINRSIHIK